MRLMWLLPLALMGCQTDETISGFAGTYTVWTLSDISGADFPARATIELLKPGQIAGQAPCNRYFASQDVPYPWFKVGPIGATKMACPELTHETVFLATLSRMSLAEVTGTTLILSNDDGETMVFYAPDA